MSHYSSLKPNGDIVIQPGAAIRNKYGTIVIDDVGNVTGGGPSPEDKRKVRVSINFSNSPYTVLNTDDVILVDATGGNVDITLETTASAGDGRVLVVKKVDSSDNLVNLNGAIGENIDGESIKTISYQWDSRQIMSDGNNWFIL